MTTKYILGQIGENGKPRTIVVEEGTTPKESGWRERFDKFFAKGFHNGEWVLFYCPTPHRDDEHPATEDDIKSFIAQVEATAIAATEARVVEQTTKKIIADYMEALGTVALPEEVWLWLADINGKHLNKLPLKNL